MNRIGLEGKVSARAGVAASAANPPIRSVRRSMIMRGLVLLLWFLVSTTIGGAAAVQAATKSSGSPRRDASFVSASRNIWRPPALTVILGEHRMNDRRYGDHDLSFEAPSTDRRMGG